MDLRSLTLEELFLRFRTDGDPDALAQVFDRTSEGLLAIAAHLVSHLDAAEDLVQATFVTAIEHREAYDEVRPLLPWLAGILAHHARNLRRKQARLQEIELPPLPALGSVASDVADREALAVIEEAIRRLPAPYAVVLDHHLCRGRSGREIALDLGRSPGTVRIQIHRGLKLLRRALPSGLKMNAILASLPVRGLDVVREHIMQHASSAVTAAGSTASAGLIAGLGGMLVAKKILVAVIVIAAAATLYTLAPTEETPEPATSPASQSSPAADGGAAPSAPAAAPASENAARDGGSV